MSDLSNPLISIIIPVFRVQSYIKDALNSCINQVYKNLEIIIIDDGSDDLSLEIAKEFARYDSRIFIITKINGGQSSARNMGIEFIANTPLREYISSLEINPIDFKDINTYEEERKCHIYKDGLHSKSLEEANFNEVFKYHKNILLLKDKEFDPIKPGAKLVSKELKDKIFRVDTNHIVVKLDRINEYIKQDLPPNQFVYFLDPDDYLNLDALSLSANYFNKDNRVECIWSPIKVTYEGITPYDAPTCYRDPFYHELYPTYKHTLAKGEDLLLYWVKLYGFFSYMVNGAIRTCLLNKGGTRFLDGVEFEDQIFGTCLMFDAKYVALSIQKVYIYRIRPNSTVTHQGVLKDDDVNMPPHLMYLRKSYNLNKEARTYNVYTSMALIAYCMLVNKHKCSSKFVLDTYILHYASEAYKFYNPFVLNRIDANNIDILMQAILKHTNVKEVKKAVRINYRKIGFKHTLRILAPSVFNFLWKVKLYLRKKRIIG